MQGGDARPKPSAASLIPIAFIAIGVLVLALVLPKKNVGTIVIQRVTVNSTTSHGGKTFRQRQISLTSITEFSANGVLQRSFSTNSFSRPGFELALSGDTFELYDPLDNTVYVTTERAQQRAILVQTKATAPKGATVHVGVGKMQTVSASSIGYTPGSNTWLRSYMPKGAARIGGRVALKYVQRFPMAAAGSARFNSNTTVYVAPGSYAPIETVNRVKVPDMRATSVERWQTYTVLPGTVANQRLTSLTARHPHARIVENAMAFLRASQSEFRSTTVRTG